MHCWLGPGPTRAGFFRGPLLVLNLCPLLLYSYRYIPSAPIAAWHRLLEGGPEQKKLCELAVPGFKRLAEEPPYRFECAFPGATALFYRVHTLSFYNAFFLKSQAEHEALPPANFRYI